LSWSLWSSFKIDFSGFFFFFFFFFFLICHWEIKLTLLLTGVWRISISLLIVLILLLGGMWCINWRKTARDLISLLNQSEKTKRIKTCHWVDYSGKPEIYLQEKFSAIIVWVELRWAETFPSLSRSTWFRCQALKSLMASYICQLFPSPFWTCEGCNYYTKFFYISHFFNLNEWFPSTRTCDGILLCFSSLFFCFFCSGFVSFDKSSMGAYFIC
jgi:hypothetical protein